MGGAGGHMSHPFDCPDVNSGQDLIDFYRKSIEWLKTNKASLKIDGVNLSFRVIRNPDMPTGYEFAIDRSSQQEVDRIGVTNANVTQKFKPDKKTGKPHGMVDATRILTAIFNDALPDIIPELKQLGMLDNIGPYSNYFNTEFVLKKINVKEYAFDFIAIHSINDFKPNRYPEGHKLAGQIRWKKNADIQVDGVGDSNREAHKEGDPVEGHIGYMWRWDPLTGWAASIPGSRSGKPIDYDRALLNRLKDKVKPHANKREFRVYTSIDTNTVGDINLEKALNTNFTIVYSSQMRDAGEPTELGIGEGSTKPIKVWLADVQRNPLKIPIIISDSMIQKYPKMNKKQFAMAKNIYLEVLNGTPVNEIVDSPEFIEPVVDGVVVWHATRELGNAVLDSQESDFGRARADGKNKEEGVVIQDAVNKNICGGIPFKFTGDFIVGGLESEFQAEQKFKQGKLLESFAVEAMPLTEQKAPLVILIPGGFKPPTSGHFSMIKQYEQRPDVSKVIVVTGFKPRKEPGLTVTYQQSKTIFDIYGGFSDKVDFRDQGKWPTPMRTCYEFMNDPNFISEFPGAIFALGASDKEGDKQRITGFYNHFQNKPAKTGAKVIEYPAAKAFEVDGEAASATRMRKAFVNGDWETFKKLMPDDNFYDDVVQVLNQQTAVGTGGGNELEENFFSMPHLFSLVDEVLLQPEDNLILESQSFIINEQQLGGLEQTIKTLAATLSAQIPGSLSMDQRVDTAGALVNTINDVIGRAIENISSPEERQETAQATAQEIEDALGTSLEEMSMASGAVAGFSGPIGDKDDRSRRSPTGI